MFSNPVPAAGHLTSPNMNEIGDFMNFPHHSEDRWPDRSESSLEVLGDAAFDGIVMAEHGIVSAANHGLAQIYGYEFEEIPGLPLDTFFGPSSQMIPLLETSRTSEFHARRKDGSALFIEVCKADLGGATCIYGIRDITHRRREEERLVESEARYHDLIAIGHDLVCTHLLDGRVLTANAAVTRVLGIPDEELQTINIQEILAPADRPQYAEYVESLRRFGTAQGTMRVMTRDGRIRVWEFQNTLMTTGGDGPFVRGLARDVTEREAALRELRHSEERSRSIIENAYDIICIIDRGGKINYHSRSMERTLGLSASELNDATFADFIHPAEARQTADFMARANDHPDHATIKLRLRHQNGSWRSFEMLAGAISYSGGAQSVLINARDITERELLEAQLVQANRLTGLGRLAATVAHEFNNVLMGMQPFAELLRQPNPSPKMLETCAHHIGNSIQRGKRVALDILRYTQPAAPVTSPLNLAAWWEALSPELQAQIGNHITFNSLIPDDLTVLADASQLAQVFSNLVNNAQDAMPEEGTLTIHAEATSKDATYPFGVVPHSSSFVHLSVSDTGSGVSEEILPQLFEPLFTTKANGTGLGLAVAHQVITRHAGYIFVESEAEVGTTFHIFLPRSSKDCPLATPDSPTERSPIRATRLLIVDDEGSITEGLSEILALEGFHVDIARTGLEAMAAVERILPDLVLLDIGLPDIDGRDVAKRLRLAHPDLPIIFSTGHGDDDALDLYSPARFLRKPFDVELLLDTIADMENDLQETH